MQEREHGILRKYYAYKDSGGNWRALIKSYKAPSKQPAAFAEFVRGLIEQQRGVTKAALEELRERIWPSGADVPGYGTWHDFFRAQYPHLDLPAKFPRIWPTGWSVRNLARYAPTRAEIKLFDGGSAAAHGSLPKIVRDTSRLRPMEIIAIDDFQLDVMCKFSACTHDEYEHYRLARRHQARAMIAKVIRTDRIFYRSLAMSL